MVSCSGNRLRRGVGTAASVTLGGQGRRGVVRSRTLPTGETGSHLCMVNRFEMRPGERIERFSHACLGEHNLTRRRLELDKNREPTGFLSGLTVVTGFIHLAFAFREFALM